MISYMLVFIGGGLRASMRYLMTMIFAGHLKYPSVSIWEYPYSY